MGNCVPRVNAPPRGQIARNVSANGQCVNHDPYERIYLSSLSLATRPFSKMNSTPANSSALRPATSRARGKFPRRLAPRDEDREPLACGAGQIGEKLTPDTRFGAKMIEELAATELCPRQRYVGLALGKSGIWRIVTQLHPHDWLNAAHARRALTPASFRRLEQVPSAGAQVRIGLGLRTRTCAVSNGGLAPSCGHRRRVAPDFRASQATVRTGLSDRSKLLHATRTRQKARSSPPSLKRGLM